MDLLGLVLQLVLDTTVSWSRMLIALAASVAVSVAVGVWVATSSRAEKLVIPVIDILQTIPILAFFPFAIYLFVAVLPGYVGVNAAVIFLIITSMVWNMIIGVYESIRTLPKEFNEVAQLYHFDIWRKLRRIYIPACLPRLVEQSILSWSIGLFYLVTSEIFSIGNSNYQVKYGIGVALIKLAQGGGAYYLLGLGVFISFVVLTRFLFFRPLEKYSTKYLRQQAQKPKSQYEKGAIAWLEKTLPRKRVVFDADGFAVNKGSRARRPIVNKKHEIPHIYALASTAALAILVYAIVSNGTLRGYELQVLPALAATFARVWIAFAVTLAIAIPVCVYIIFMSRRSSQYMLLFQILASVPATVLLPIIALAFANKPEVVAFVIFLLSSIWYVIFSVVASTMALPSNVFEVQKVFGIKGGNAWKNIYLKAIIPGLITGAMTGIAAEWNASIVAEYFTAQGVTSTTNVISQVGIGIGKLLDLSLSANGQGLGLMVIALINLVVMILFVNTFVWKRFYNRVARVYR